MKKIVIGVVALALVPIGLALIVEKSVSTSITIASSAENVWKVLMDERGYQQWNPVLVPLEGEIAPGARMRYRWTQPNGEAIEVESKVITADDSKKLHQRGGIPGILTFDHRYTLTHSGGSTLVEQSEVYKGLGVLFWDASQMEPAYRAVNEALKRRVEGTDG